MKKVWLMVFSLLLVLVQANVSGVKTANTIVSVDVPVYLEISEIPDAVIVVTDPTLEKIWSEVMTFSVKTNVPAKLSVPLTTILNQIGGTETLEVMHSVAPQNVESPGGDVHYKLAWVNINGLNTMAGTYKGEVTVTMSLVI